MRGFMFGEIGNCGQWMHDCVKKEELGLFAKCRVTEVVRLLSAKF